MNRFKTITEAREYLVSKGFHEFNPPSFSHYNNAATCFQKCYKDDIGKKYFIDALVWDFTFTNKIPEDYTVSFEGQYYQKTTHNAINMEFGDWELEDVERFLDDLFELEVLEYYEEWEDA